MEWDSGTRKPFCFLSGLKKTDFLQLGSFKPNLTAAPSSKQRSWCFQIDFYFFRAFEHIGKCYPTSGGPVCTLFHWLREMVWATSMDVCVQRVSLRLEGREQGRISFILSLVLNLSKRSAITQLQGFFCLFSFSLAKIIIKSLVWVQWYHLCFNSEWEQCCFMKSLMLLFVLSLRKKTQVLQLVFWRQTLRQEPVLFPYGNNQVATPGSNVSSKSGLPR